MDAKEQLAFSVCESLAKSKVLDTVPGRECQIVYLEVMKAIKKAYEEGLKDAVCDCCSPSMTLEEMEKAIDNLSGVSEVMKGESPVMTAKEQANKNFEENKHHLANSLSNLFNVEKACGDELIKQARNDALEEAAKECDRLMKVCQDPDDMFEAGCEKCAISIAKAIRDLKEK